MDHSPYLGQPLRTYSQALDARRRPFPPTEAPRQYKGWITRAPMIGLAAAGLVGWALMIGAVFLALEAAS